MELVIDLKIDNKSSSYRNVITDFGYFKKITGESNQNISYIRNATKAEFSIKPCFTGINDGLTITLKHNTLDGVDNAKRLLLSLIDTMKDDFEVFKMNKGIPMDGKALILGTHFRTVMVMVELNLAVCGECGFMSTSFPEFEDHVTKDHGSRKQQAKTPWGKAPTMSRDSGFNKTARAPQKGLDSGDGNYNLRSTPQRSSVWSKDTKQSPYQPKAAATARPTYGRQEKPSAFGAARRPATTTAASRPAASTRTFVGGLAAKRSALGFAASKYAPTTTRRPTSFGLAAKRSTVGRPAAATRLTTTTATTRRSAFESSRDTMQSKADMSMGIGSKRGASNVTSDIGANKRPKMSRFDYGGPTSAAGKGASQDVKRKPASGIPREQTLLARRLRNDLNDAETKVAIQQLKNKLSPTEAKEVYQQIGESVKRGRLAQSEFFTLQLKTLVGALNKKKEGSGLNTASKPQTVSSAKKSEKDRAPPDPERMVTVRLSLEALLRRRNANVLSDQAGDAMCRKLMAAAVPKGKAEMVLRQSWESLIERKRFEQRREPKRGEKVSIMLTTVVNYIKQEVQDRNVSNSTMEAIMDVLKPQPKPTDPEEPSHNIPIFPVLEKSHATERSIDTRLHWMIAEISFTLNKRKSGQMPDQEVNMVIARIKNGVPSVYYDVVNKRFEETARDIEKMGNRRMSASRKLTCQLQVICTYARHYLMDKLPGGSPLDPALHRNPFQYIDYDINEKPPAKKGVQPLMGAKTGPKAVKPLMSMNTRSGMSSEQKITDIASLVATMDKAAAEEDKQRILELREYAKEARMGVAAMGVRRVEKIEGDLLRKMPNKFKGDLQQHKKEMENNKGRKLTARERLETTIKWILQNIHASGDGPKSPTTTGPKKSSMPPIIRMRGAEVLKREGMKLWNKFKTGRPMLTEITKQLTALRDRLTRPEGDIIKSTYNAEIQKISKNYKVTRLPDSVAAAAKFEATFKYVMGDDDPIAKEFIARDAARKFYDTLNNKQSPVKKYSPKANNNKSPARAANGNQKKDDDDDIMIIDDFGKGKMSNDQRIMILRNKFNTIARQFRQNQMNVDKIAEIIALSKTNLYLSCDDEDDLFVEVRCAWEDNGGDDLSEKKKLTIEFNLTTKRILAKVEELIDTEGDITVADVKERLGAVMSSQMIDV